MSLLLASKASLRKEVALVKTCFYSLTLCLQVQHLDMDSIMYHPLRAMTSRLKTATSKAFVIPPPTLPVKWTG